VPCRWRRYIAAPRPTCARVGETDVTSLTRPGLRPVRTISQPGFQRGALEAYVPTKSYVRKSTGARFGEYPGARDCEKVGCILGGEKGRPTLGDGVGHWANSSRY
jgi:hypothetical protein